MKREYDSIIEYRILEYLNENYDNKNITIDILNEELFGNESKSAIQRVLLDMKALVGTTPYQITTLGKHRLIEYKEAKNEKWKYFWRGSIVSIVAALVGITPTIIQSVQRQPQQQYIVIPKVETIHDTIIVKDSLVKP